MLRTCLAALATAVLAASAQAQPAERTVDAVVAHHIQAAAASDLDAVMSDFADDAILMTPAVTLQGKAAIRANFQAMWAVPGGPPKFDSTQLKSEGEVGYIQWVMNPGKPDAAVGRDAVVVRHGRIALQAVFIGAEPK